MVIDAFTNMDGINAGIPILFAFIAGSQSREKTFFRAVHIKQLFIEIAGIGVSDRVICAEGEVVARIGRSGNIHLDVIAVCIGGGSNCQR